jgi:lon-related putative ATP-dependent protease
VPPSSTAVDPLPPEALYRRCDPASLGFASTRDLSPAGHAVGQARATEAIEFGLRMRAPHYNVFAFGPAGTGKRTLIQQLTMRAAAALPAPRDWVYLNNFSEAHRPRALSLPPCRGQALRQDLRGLIDDLKAAIPAAFETDEYRARRKTIDEELRQKQKSAFEGVEREAEHRGQAILRTPFGMGVGPVRDGKVLEPQEFRSLPEPEQERLKRDMDYIQEQLQAVLAQAPRWESERHERIRALDREVTRWAVSHLIGGIATRYEDVPSVVAHLRELEQDVVEHAVGFLAQQTAQAADAPVEMVVRQALADTRGFERYTANLIVDRGGCAGAPVVEEDHPTLQNLLGRVEYRPQLGALVTDFSLIKPGALHRANGGFLVLDARRVLMQPFAWEALKQTLRSQQIKIQSGQEMLGMVSAETLQPEPIPLDVKVILTGDRSLYYLLAAADPDFREIFKVAADFDEAIDRDGPVEASFARLIAAILAERKLRPLDAPAVARVIEHATRLAADRRKLSLEVESIADLLHETDHLAGESGREIVTAAEVQAALDAQERRAGRIRDRYREAVRRRSLLIETKGAKVGQINGLSVMTLPEAAFGHPTRITARLRLGKGDVVDIEREVELGGPIHSKGVLILSGFLGGRFGRRRPLSIGASLVFEQSYGGVEGDSASLAELCALMSAIGQIPIEQRFAVTGSINQHGEVQPIGGANEKVEGFFDVCCDQGLDGSHAVIIPTANIDNLMLKAAVVQAVRDGKFHIYAAATVDEALTLLTGQPAGTADADGRFPSGTVNARVDAELDKLADNIRRFAAPAREGATA